MVKTAVGREGVTTSYGPCVEVGVVKTAVGRREGRSQETLRTTVQFSLTGQ